MLKSKKDVISKSDAVYNRICFAILVNYGQTVFLEENDDGGINSFESLILSRRF